MACLSRIPTPAQTANTSSNLSAIGQNTLLSLDSNGHLANLVQAGNWETIKNCLDSALPLTVWFNLTVFDENMHVLNPYSVSNAGVISTNIVSVNYVCASETSSYHLYVLRLQLSEVGPL